MVRFRSIEVSAGLAKIFIRFDIESVVEIIEYHIKSTQQSVPET